MWTTTDRRGIRLLVLASIPLCPFFAAPGRALVRGLSEQGAQWFENQTVPFYPVDSSERFGLALAAGDFNGDGATDLATAIPFDTGTTIHPQYTTGAVIVRWGIPGVGLAAGIFDTLLNAYAPDSQITPEETGGFGQALAVGDFNGDGLDDLAIGAPTSDGAGGVGSERGLVSIHYGLPTGIQLAGEHILRSGSPGFPAIPGSTDHDELGAALAAGDFDGDGYDDLAIGVPQSIYFFDTQDGAGAVVVVHGHFGGLYPIAAYVLRQGVEGVPDVAENGDGFGAALTTGNFNGDTRCVLGICRSVDDLAIGTPGENHRDGAVMTVFGSPWGLIFNLSNYLNQFELGSISFDSNDAFGTALAAGDFDGDGEDELVVGTPDEDLTAGTSVLDAGELEVIYGLRAFAPFFSSAVRYDTGTVSNGSDPILRDDRLGQALSVGDFDGDGFEDLAVGRPGLPVVSVPSRASPPSGGFQHVPAVGAVLVAAGSASGLSSQWRTFEPSLGPSLPAPDGGGCMGSALAAGDFDGDGISDLAIGLPYRRASDQEFAGAEIVLYATPFADGFESGTLDGWSLVVP
ncbi:MAG: hypothetical protein ABI639_08390 [Thermoanaerobaculia bacterium]